MTAEPTFLGVDLAWGARHQSGLAEVSSSGELVTLTQRTADSELLEWLGLRTAGPVVVAFDAPLVVNNPIGSRPGERAIGHYFGRYKASCHPSSRANPAFADGGRAHRLATRLELSVDPFVGAPRIAIEVYPHPATVMLFGLTEVLRYKNKPGRSLELRRAELLRLMDGLEALADAPVRLDVRSTEEWSVVRRAVETTLIKAGLSRVEDSIDAVVCAYVALYATRLPAGTGVFGTSADGFIITPVAAEMAGRFPPDVDDAAVHWPARRLAMRDCAGAFRIECMTDQPTLLKGSELTAALVDLPGWRVENDALVTVFAMPSAAAALSLIAAIGNAAESINHHPDVDWRYDHVFVCTTTHDAGGGVTQLDLDLAQGISALALEAGGTAEPHRGRAGA